MRNRLLKFEYIPLQTKMEYIILLNFIFFIVHIHQLQSVFCIVMWFIPIRKSLSFYMGNHNRLLMFEYITLFLKMEYIKWWNYLVIFLCMDFS